LRKLIPLPDSAARAEFVYCRDESLRRIEVPHGGANSFSM
jgi:hypothetical protein